MPAHVYHILIATLALILTAVSASPSHATTSYVIGKDDRVPVDFAKFPWLGQVAIPKTSTNGFCTGTLVSPTLVLTAGHCFSNLQVSGDVIIGKQATFFLQQRSAGQKAWRTGKVVAGFYQPMSFLQRHIDWALVRLDQPVIAPRYPDVSAVDETQDISHLRVFWYGYPDDLGDSEAFVHPMCSVGGWMSGREAFYTYCDNATGESGGPITILRNGKEVIIGVVSGGLPSSLGFSYGSNLRTDLKQIRALIDADLFANRP